MAHVSADDASVLMIHGTADPLVPLLSSTAMHSTIQQAGGTSKLITIENGDHMFAGPHYDRAVTETVSWFQHQLLD